MGARVRWVVVAALLCSTAAAGPAVPSARCSDELTATAVVGGGLSGLTAALHLLEAGRSVVLVDKRRFLGGNSAWASSGINGGLTPKQQEQSIDDSADRFYEDTIRSAQRAEGSFTAALARKMADDSSHAVQWIADHADVHLPDVGQLGGHSVPRTHRPRDRLSGAAFISGLERAVMRYLQPAANQPKANVTTPPPLQLLKGVTVTALRPAETETCGASDITDTAADSETESDSGWTLTLKSTSGTQEDANDPWEMTVRSVVLATGGYSADKAEGGLISEVAPHLLGLGTTNNLDTTGDGIKLGRAVGAQTIDMDMVQVHPTGFSDEPAGFKSTGKERPLVLCAEILRGVGAVLLERTGKRFVNELATRKAVVARMGALEPKQSQFAIVLPPAAALKVEAHAEIYSSKQLLHNVSGAAGVADFVARRLTGPESDGSSAEASQALVAQVAATFQHTSAGEGEFYVERSSSTVLPVDGEYLVGVVQPVLHYTMGGLAVDPNTTTVLRATPGTGAQDVAGIDPAHDLRSGAVETAAVGAAAGRLEGLFAAGELVGAVHGVNRLGGSSLLDCVVFGIAAAKSAASRAPVTHNALPFDTSAADSSDDLSAEGEGELSEASALGPEDVAPPGERVVVQIGKWQYDVSRFIEVHPGGPIVVADGEDLSSRFIGAHGKDWGLLERPELSPPLVVDSATGELRRAAVRSEKKKAHRLAKYGSEGGSWREILGRHSWFLLHSLAAKFPEHPAKADQDAIIGIVAGLGQLYPCKLCRKHLQQQLRDVDDLPPVSTAVGSRTNLTQWICHLHNIVNRDIGKPQYDCSPLNLDLMYLKDCGECAVQVPGKNAAMRSGFHAESGPWDMAMYASRPRMLHAVTKSTDLWKMQKASKMVERLLTLKLIKEKDADRLEAQLIGPGGKKLMKTLKGAMRQATAHLRDSLSGVQGLAGLISGR